MECNVLLAGVGGQGILTIAAAISRVALEQGYHVKQSEVHGMSQRGGAVQAHLRFADHAIHSDLIPEGQADLLVSVEPLEALRYTNYLGDRSVVVAGVTPFANIRDYPPIDNVLDRIGQLGDHVLIDAQRLARLAGSSKAENVVVLGAATLFLNLPVASFEKLIHAMFAAKGERVVEINRRALRMGRFAAEVFREGLRGGQTSRYLRKWVETIPNDRFSAAGGDDHPFVPRAPSCALSDEAGREIDGLLNETRRQGRVQLFEHEVYRIVELAGAISPARHVFLPDGTFIEPAELARMAGERVVLKLVSPDVVHKTEAGGVAFVSKDVVAVRRAVERMTDDAKALAQAVAGVLVVEFVEEAGHGLGSELFVGIRQTREFGPVIAAGLGGVDTEYLATAMRAGVAVAKAAAMDTSPERFFKLFEETAAYSMLAGTARGHERIVGDAELMRCFNAFIALARRCCAASAGGACLDELEVNPFAFRGRKMVPLDGRGRLGEPIAAARSRPLESVARMLEPESIAVVGVSGKRENFGRIILNNIQACGFPAERLYVVKPGEDVIDGVRCVPSVSALPERVDLLVAATGAERVPALVEEVLPGADRAGQCRSVILIPGGLGEKEGTEGSQEAIHQAIEAARRRHPETPVFLGGNCMGLRSRPGRYDTFFIPPSKLDARREAAPRRCAIVSQSGAFLITRMSNLEFLDPTLAISIGNQADVTVSDLVYVVGRRDDIDCIGVYVEGFNRLDGLAFLAAVEHAIAFGKTVVFYKAGRTPAGRSAARGHTASVAGDYDICQAAVAAAGAIVTDTFKEFEQLLELATSLHGKKVGGKRIGAMSNAGYEAVGMADTVKGARYEVEMPALTADTRARIEEALQRHGLSRLVDARNPLDLTPMAGDAAYEDCLRVMVGADELDAVIVACVPMTPMLLTTALEIQEPGSIVHRLAQVFQESTKSMVFVVDCGGPYEALARTVRAKGIPVFRSADQCVRSLGRYLSHRAACPSRSTGRAETSSGCESHQATPELMAL
ncbi:MAG: indolepyruvate oxidoreductase subunit beta [Phycisphaerales bacterium]|nr:indolepyruvate oxidoreductase subunit beta [Phycisphaerales bacterium]